MRRPLFWIGICFIVLVAILYNCSLLPDTFLPELDLISIEDSRSEITDLIVRKFPIDVSGILCAIIIGDKSYLTNEIQNNFNLCGMSHILVVSGMHLATTAMLLKGLLAKISRKKKSIIVIIFVWLYVLLTGCGISTIRAAIMLSMIEIGHLFRRQSDPLTSLSLAGIIITAISPSSATSNSFILSFCSVLGLCLFGDFLPSSIASIIGILPALAMLFGYVPLFGFLANLLVVPLISPILILGMIFLVVPSISPVLNIFVKLIIFISELFAKIPHAYLGVGAPWQKFIILTLYFFIAYCLAIKPDKIFIKNVSAILLSFTLLANTFALLFLNNVVTVIQFRKENIEVFALGTHAIIFNSPTEYEQLNLTYYLRANNITNIDALVIEDEVIPNSAYSFIKYNKVDKIIAPNAISSDGLLLYDETFSREKLYDIIISNGYKFRTKIEKLS